MGGDVGAAEAPLAEGFLVRMNQHLAGLQDAEYVDDVEDRPVIVVVGPPRTGTTLTIQLLASCLGLGFIDNLAAAFWRAPTYGIRLSQVVNVHPFLSTYRSRFGRTSGPAEPHEFGYFWNRLLGLRPLTEPTAVQRNEVDWGRVRSVVLNVAAALDAPWVFKGFHLTWVLEEFTRALPSSVVVRMHRDEGDTARSILRMREVAFGGVDHWASLRPASCDSLTSLCPEEQAAAQVFLVEQSLTRQLEGLPSHRLVDVSLERMRDDPAWIVETVSERLARLGAALSVRAPAPERLTRPMNDSTDRGSYEPDDDLIARAFARLRAQMPREALRETP